MSFDVLVAQAVALELQELVGARVERLIQPSAEEVALSLFGPRGKAIVFFSANAAHARLHLVKSPPDGSCTLPFCLALRRHLEGARLRGVFLPPLERVITLHFKGPPIRGERDYHLIAEIMGRHSNLVLVEPASGLIIDGLKRYSHAVSRYREVLPGQPYLPPPVNPNKADPLTLREEDLGAVLLAAGEEKTLEKSLIQSLVGFGPQLAREVIARAGLEPDLAVEFCGSRELAKLWLALAEIREIVRSGRFRPTLVVDHGRAVTYAAIELKQYQGLTQLGFPSMSLAIEKFYEERLAQEKWLAEKNRLAQLVEAQRKRWLKKMELQREALAKAEEAERYRLVGEVITANLHRLSRGARVLEAPNPYNPEEVLRVELDPALSPADNAQLQFKKYRKAKAQAEQASAQLALAQEELAYWESVGESLERAETLADLAEIDEELKAQLGTTEGKPKRSRTKQPLPSPLKFTSPDGYTVLVGKNNRQNDYLTTRLARPEDLWLHAKGIPGAHVLVRNPTGDPIPPQTLEYAAGLAAFYSQARLDSLVPVDYTLAKYVYKGKGAKPGMVYYTHQKTIMIRPRPPDN